MYLGEVYRLLRILGSIKMRQNELDSFGLCTNQDLRALRHRGLLEVEPDPGESRTFIYSAPEAQRQRYFMESLKVKQVILVRKDLNMRKGKLAAQVAHASMKVFLDCKIASDPFTALHIPLWPAAVQWLTGPFGKVVLGVDNEAELIFALSEAERAGIPTALIRDQGRTEFHGVETVTCAALGPWDSAELDKITGPSGSVKTSLL